jgi:nitrous oxidase accessory protein NosD
MNALTAGRTWKEKVIVKGNYAECNQLLIPNYTILELQGRITAVAALNLSLVVQAGGATTDIEICGGIWNMNKAAQAADCSTIFLSGIAYAWVHHTRVMGGLRAAAARGEGIEIYNCTYAIVAYNYVELADHDGIKLRQTCYYCIVANNTCYSDNQPQESAGIQFYISCYECVAIGNTVFGNNGANAHGLKMHNTFRCSFVGNTVRFCARHGIAIYGQTNPADDNVVADNIIEGNNTGNGIALTGDNTADRNLFVNNQIYGCTTGILISVSGSRTRIIGNTIVSSAGLSYGVNVSVAHSYMQINDNWIYGAKAGTEYGIRLNGSDYCLVEGNYFEHLCSDSGEQAAITMIGCEYCSIVGNKAEDLGRHGIRMVTSVCQYNLIEANYIRTTTQTGIALNGAHQYNMIQNNYVRDCTTGISLFNGPTLNIIRFNTLLNNGTTVGFSASGVLNSIEWNYGYNPVGNIANPFDNANYRFGPLGGCAGGAAGPTVANQNYVCTGCGCILDITAGTDVSVTLKDPAGNTISVIGATPVHALYVPRDFIVHFGAFTGAPTVVVSGI